MTKCEKLSAFMAGAVVTMIMSAYVIVFGLILLRGNVFVYEKDKIAWWFIMLPLDIWLLISVIGFLTEGMFFRRNNENGD